MERGPSVEEGPRLYVPHVVETEAEVLTFGEQAACQAGGLRTKRDERIEKFAGITKAFTIAGATSVGRRHAAQIDAPEFPEVIALPPEADWIGISAAGVDEEKSTEEMLIFLNQLCEKRNQRTKRSR